MKLLARVFSRKDSKKTSTASAALAVHASNTAAAYAPPALGSAAIHASRKDRRLQENVNVGYPSAGQFE